MTRRCVCPGSYDPVTLGHADVIERAAALYDEVVVAVLLNPAKAGTFTPEERQKLLEDTVAHLPNVRVELFSNRLLVDVCREADAEAIVKGLRGGTDFAYELPMALMNRHLTGIETRLPPRRPALRAHLQLAHQGGRPPRRRHLRAGQRPGPRRPCGPPARGVLTWPGRPGRRASGPTSRACGRSPSCSCWSTTRACRSCRTASSASTSSSSSPATSSPGCCCASWPPRARSRGHGSWRGGPAGCCRRPSSSSSRSRSPRGSWCRGGGGARSAATSSGRRSTSSTGSWRGARSTTSPRAPSPPRCSTTGRWRSRSSSTSSGRCASSCSSCSCAAVGAGRPTATVGGPASGRSGPSSPP